MSRKVPTIVQLARRTKLQGGQLVLALSLALALSLSLFPSSYDTKEIADRWQQ